MPQNLELKARIRSIASARAIAHTLGAGKQPTLVQVDTYFDIPEGRLKLRVINGRTAELIYYDRSSVKGSAGRRSSYLIFPVGDAQRLRMMLASAFGVRMEVKKRREVLLFRNARIHLDVVQGLGSFIEFEVLESRGAEQARRLFRHLRGAFRIRGSNTIGGSYADLMLRPLRRKR